MKIHDNEGKLLAIIVKKNEQTAGKNFYTDDSSELQLATFELSEDEIIDRHIHDDQIRNIVRTSEAIILQEGVLVFDIYDNDLNPITQVSLEAGDIILLLDGGHGIKVKKKAKFIEVKQGPYDEQNDKRRF
jgi:hypothetical protein